MRKWCFINPFQFRLRRGIETYLWELLNELSDIGVEPYLLTWKGKKTPPHWIQLEKVNITTVPHSRFFQEWIAGIVYFFYFLSHKFDHVFINFAGYGEGIALWLLKLVKVEIKYSIVLHYPSTLVPWRYQEFEKFGLFSKAMNIICVSDRVADDLKNWTERKPNIIYNGVNLARFSPENFDKLKYRIKNNVPENAFTLLTIAALEERKGIQYVLYGLKKLLLAIPNIRFLVVGIGPYKTELEKITVVQGITNHVIFIGEVKDVTPYILMSDLGILLSKGEAFPITILEYMAGGLPVITSDEPPFDKLVGKEFGYKLATEDLEGLISTVTHLYKDDDLRHQMGIVSREVVANKYSLQRISKSYKELVLDK